MPVIAEDDVLAFFKIDIGRAALMNGVDKPGQSGEEFVVNRVILLKWSPLDIIMDDSSLAIPAAECRHTRQPTHQKKQFRLMTGKETTRPRQGQPKHGRYSADLQDDLVIVPLIEGGHGKEVVFERLNN